MTINLNKPNVVIFANSCWTVLNFRANLLKELKSAGCKVTVIAANDSYCDRLISLGCEFEPIGIKSRGKNLIYECKTLLNTFFLLRKISPDILLSFTIKPNIYGSILAPLLGYKVINNITGLGSIFSSDNFLTNFIQALYKLAFIKSSTVFFQNSEDMELFLKHGLVKKSQCERLPGSGVNLKRFSYSQPGKLDGRKFRFILIARMLWDKGIADFVSAARIINAKFPNTEFCLLGFLDSENPASISESQMNLLTADGVTTYRGGSEDVLSELVQADCVVLPTYYKEGVPKSLLEAGAVGRPIITTSMPGCRDAVDNGINGYLCQARDPIDLARNMEKMLLLSDEERLAMGFNSRKKMELMFDERIVIDKYMKFICKALKIDKV
jgi:glycosyltransferase involved in cell wall biosynthesis